MQLTAEQQTQIEESLWVVNTALKRQGQSQNEDLRQSAILYMCSCMLRFDPTMNVKWTTYAYRNVYLFIKRTLIKEREKLSHLIKSDYDDLANILPAVDEIELVNGDDRYIQSVCNLEEQTIIELKKQGFNGKEIARKMNCSSSKINCCLQNVRHKIKEIQREL